MASADLVMHEEDLGEIQAELTRLQTGSNARFVFLIDRAGQHLALVGQAEGIDATSLASLAAGNVAATEGLAQVLGEPAFRTLYQEGEEQSLHISLIGSRTILVLAFDEHSSLGLVRLRVKQSTGAMLKILDAVQERNRAAGASNSPLAGITDEDIDSLFSD